MSGHTDDTGDDRLAAEGDVALARLAIDSGDLAHAADHLGDAILADPQLPELHEALAELCAAAGGPAAARELFPLDGQVYLGTVACRAHVEAAAGDWDTAVGLLASAVQHEPARPWAHAAWLAREDLPGLVDPDAVAQAVARATGALPDPLPAEPAGAVRPFHDFVQAVLARHEDHVSLLAMASGLTRRLGDTDRAVELADRAHRLAPGYLTAVMLGNALRSAGRPERALAVWEAELARVAPDRDDSSSYLAVDVAELYGALGRPAEGLPWLDRVLAAEPDHPKAGPARYGLRHALDGDPAHLLGLADHHRSHPEHEYAQELLERLSHREPWLGLVSGATEATVNVLHQVLAAPDTGRDTEIDCTASTVEPPSSVLAVRLALPRSTVDYRAVGEPDPRLPLTEPTTRIWAWDGTDPRPAVAPPAPRSAELVRATAEIFWPTVPAAYDHAVRLAGLPLDDLLGVLVHPPAPREDELGRALLAHQPELWVRAVQVFACLGIAHHRTDQPWAGSERRRVLRDLLLGPEDWVVEAAGFALVAIGWTQPQTRADVAALLQQRLHHGARARRTRAVTILRSLSALVLAAPWTSDEDRALARHLMEQEDAADAGAEAAPEAADQAEAAERPGTAGQPEAAERSEAERAAGEEPRPGRLRRLFGRG
ncbi:tetratricopeptide repeat protein [Kitasatospora sp. NPDC127116]|uniref:tetratricopeptide repeat protein n=1 Tax=Kitasatospora sp. NPDC127116 TaxID=3345367 RepID=UPI0036312FA6